MLKKAKIDLRGLFWIRSAQILHVLWSGTKTSWHRQSNDTLEISWHDKQEALEDVSTIHKRKRMFFCHWKKKLHFTLLKFSVGERPKAQIHIVSWWNAGTHRSFVAYTALHHMLVRLALHRYGTLTDPAKDDGSAAAIWTALWGVWRRGLTWYQSTGEWCQTWG